MSDMRKISNINGYIEGNSKWPDFDKKICEEGNVVFTIPALKSGFETLGDAFEVRSCPRAN